MSIKSRDDLKKKFLNGMYPPQEDFHDWQDSYWHKNDQLPGMDAKAVEYNQQDLSSIILTPFKHHLSINKIENNISLSFEPMDGIVGKIMLLVQNIADVGIQVTIPELPALINMEESNEIVLPPGAFAEILLAGYGDYQTIKYRIKQKAIAESVFNTDKDSLRYSVSDGKGFDITDTLLVTSSKGGAYADYEILSVPDWLTATKASQSGISSNIQLMVRHNRGSDDPRNGTIRLKQNGTDKEITITVFQWGRLHENVPTEYPYTTKDNIDDLRGGVIRQIPYPVAQIGEQIWSSRDLFDSAELSGNTNYFFGRTIRQGDVDHWKMDGYDSGPYKWVYDFPVGGITDYDDPLNSATGYAKMTPVLHASLGARRMKADWNASTRDDIYTQNIPFVRDFAEMLGFIVANNWDGTSELTRQYVRQHTNRKTFAKRALDITTNGYDEERTPYPEELTTDIAQVGYPVLITGTDDYALAFVSGGATHISNEINDQGNKRNLMVTAGYHTRDRQPYLDGGFGGGTNGDEDLYWHLTAYYRIIKNLDELNTTDPENPANNNEGWSVGNSFTGYIAKPIRTMRYRADLPFELYVKRENDVVTDIVKIDKTAGTAPDGYEVLEFGVLRGAWFGGFSKGVQKFTISQLLEVENLVKVSLKVDKSNGNYSDIYKDVKDFDNRDFYIG